jgi:predicted phosphodiesterase
MLAPSPAVAAGSPAPFYNGPYLQNLAATSVEVRFELDAPAPATLEIASGAEKARAIADPAAAFHSIRIDGLAPQTPYRYVVRVGGAASPEGHFVTAPTDDTRTPFTFLLYGDSRSNDEAHAAVVRAMGKRSFDFLVNTGDFVAAGGERPLWHTFFSIEADLLRDHAVFACVGNHELLEDESASNFLTYFGPRAGGDPGHVELYRSFRWQGARFFMLNAFQDWSHGELSWLRRELDRADAEPGLSARIVVVHHSPWSAGHHGDDAKMLAAGVPDLLVRHHVDVVLAGHDHIYERGEWKELKYVISGGSGAPLYPDIHPKPSSRRDEATYNFVRVTVDGDAVRMIAERPDGSTIEACGFRGGGSWDCDGDARGPDPSAADRPPGSSAEARPAPPPAQEPAAQSRCGCSVPGIASSPSALFPVALGGITLAVRRRRASAHGERSGARATVPRRLA